MERIEINVQTGEKTIVQLTPEEVATEMVEVAKNMEWLKSIVNAGKNISDGAETIRVEET